MSEKQVRDYDKFMLRFPDGMRDAIAERAKHNGRSMNSEIIQIIEDTLTKDGEYLPPLGSGDPNQKFFIESYIDGRFERLEGTLKELLKKIDKTNNG